MASGKNPFGGGNPRSLYTPMSEDEQEVLSRLIDADELFIDVVGWGRVHKFHKVIFGDANLDIQFFISFSRPQVHIPLHHLDLQLRMRSRPDLILIRKRYPFNPPQMVGEGATLGLGWTISIRKMSSRFVKMIKRGAIGLTTREGNRHLDSDKAKLLRFLRNQEEKVRKSHEADVAVAEDRAEEDVKAGRVLTLPTGG